MNTITHKIRDNISQASYDAQRDGVAPPLAKNLGYFESWGQYLLAINMLKDAAMVVAHKPGTEAAADELAWLGDSQDTILPASRCFEVLADLLHVPDAKQFQLAFIDAVERDADAMHRALRSLQVSVESGREKDSDLVPMAKSMREFVEVKAPAHQELGIAVNGSFPLRQLPPLDVMLKQGAESAKVVDDLDAGDECVDDEHPSGLEPERAR